MQFQLSSLLCKVGGKFTHMKPVTLRWEMEASQRSPNKRGHCTMEEKFRGGMGNPEENLS